jgi:hypothetical protein
MPAKPERAADSIEMTRPLLRARDTGKSVCNSPTVPPLGSKQVHSPAVSALPAY